MILGTVDDTKQSIHNYFYYTSGISKVSVMYFEKAPMVHGLRLGRTSQSHTQATHPTQGKYNISHNYIILNYNHKNSPDLYLYALIGANGNLLQVQNPADVANFDSYPADPDVPPDEFSGWDEGF